MVSYEQWLEAFQQAYRAPDRIAELACPNCVTVRYGDADIPNYRVVPPTGCGGDASR